MARVPDPDSETLVLILAGGGGRRIGGNKADRLLGGQRLIERALQLAKLHSPHIAISVAAGIQVNEPDQSIVPDRYPDWGPLAGIEAGLREAERRGLSQLLTLPCDSPFLPPDLLTRLDQAMQAGVLAALPRSEGRLHAACGLWSIGASEWLTAYGEEGGRSLRGLAHRLGHEAVDWRATPSDPFFNINTEADLAAAERMLAARRVAD